MIYLASPYSHESFGVRTKRYIAACKAAGELMSRGEEVFSPIAHSHGIALCGDLPIGWEYWENIDRECLRVCSSVTVLKLDGWEQSKGISAEVAIAEELGLPVTYADPKSLGNRGEMNGMKKKARKRTTLTPQQKADRARQRMIEKAHESSTGTYSAKFVAPVFQRMIRAEAAARPECLSPAVVEGKMHHVGRFVRQCVCVTCGRVAPWTSKNGIIQTGHFLPSRCFSILYEEDNVAPQCIRCNNYEHGALDRFRLTRLKATKRQFTHEELVDMRIGYKARLEAAVKRMRR